MPRSLWLTLFFIVLLTPFVLRWAIGSAARPSGARDELRLVIITPHAESIRTEFADAFSAWHRQKYGQGVLVDYRIYGGATDIVRYFDNGRGTLFKELGTFQVDLAWGGGDDLFDRRLKRPGYLEGVKLGDDTMRRAFEQQAISGLPLYDLASDPPQWFGTALSSFGIVYNKDVLHYLELPEPTTWTDLADPRYRGWLVLADPTRSGVAKTSFMVIVERAMQDAIDAGQSPDAGWARGMGLIRQIAANARNFTDGSTGVSGIVGAGEAGAGMAIDFHARSQVDAVQVGNTSRLGYVEPRGATAINPDPIALVKGAEHRDVAIRFIEYILSEPGQRLWNTRAGAPGGPRTTSLRRLPIRKSVYDDPRDFTDPVNPYVAAS
ncbi:MAG: extracellular solute-binding protein, partial [Tepidisphaeraceae bacterium]